VSAHRSFHESKLAQDIFVGDALPSGDGSPPTLDRGCGLRRNIFRFHWRGRQWINHHVQQVDYRLELSYVELVDEIVGLFFVGYSRH
jgi:hypothetical protein